MRDLLTRTLRLVDVETLALYWRVAIKPNRKQALKLLLLMVGSAVLDVISVGLTVPLLDVVTSQGQAHRGRVVTGLHAVLQSLGVAPSTNMVIFSLMVFVSLLFVVRNALMLWNQHCTAEVAVTLRSALKVSLFDRFLRARYEEIAKRSRGAIVHDIHAPPEALAATITSLGGLCTGLLNLVFMISLLFYLSWWATILLGVVAVGGIQGWRWYADRRAATDGHALYVLRSEQSKIQIDAIDGMRIVKTHGLERQMVERQRTLLGSELGSELRLVFFRNGPNLVNELIAITIVLTLGVVTFLLPSWGVRFSTLTVFLLAMRRIAPATSSVSTAIVNLNQHRQNLETIEEVMKRVPQEPRGGQIIDQVMSVHLDHLSFAYPTRPDHQVITSITAMMRRGTVTAFVGSTGAGKSTIANLLMGLYYPIEGSILINGVGLDQLDLSAWRQRVGYVSQDIFIFNATIQDNIILGDEVISETQMIWAAQVAQLHDFIRSLPEGYHTLVGDRGLRLSGGQCQRLAIARAILHKPQVLIFDEATSALDNLTERAVYDAISVLHRDAIVLVIAHRLSTVRDADQILVLENGQIAEQGTHEMLMSQRGVYARLYEEDAPAHSTVSEPAIAITHHDPA